jgi:hypothetical protein
VVDLVVTVMRATRFMLSTCCAMVLALGLLFLLAALDDAYSPGLPPAWFRYFVLMVEWPSTATALVLHQDPPAGICAWTLLAVTGLFWGAVGEFVFALNNARKP